MSGELCLKWNNHSSAFNKLLDDIFLKEVYSDGTIVCQGNFYPVHRFVLSTCSDYFAKMFEQCGHSKNKYPFIIVKDIQCSQMEALLNYMYKGEVNVPQDELPELIIAAEAFKIKGLAVPDEEPVQKLSRKRLSASSPSSHSKKSKRFDDGLPNNNISQRCKQSLNMNMNVDENMTGHPVTDCNSKNEELIPVDIAIIKSEPLCIEEDNSKNDENELRSPIKMEEQNSIENLPDDTLRFHSLPYNPSNVNFDGEQSTSWDNTEEFSNEMENENYPPQNTLAQPIQENYGSCILNQRPSSITTSLFKCPFSSTCTYRSYNKHNVDRHYRRHTGEKPFACPYCPYTCSTKDNLLKKHIPRCIQRTTNPMPMA